MESLPGNRRSHFLYLGLAAATILAGLLLRLVPLGLPTLLVQYGGSVLWAFMVYLLLAAIQPRRKPVTLAFVSYSFAALVEVFRLHHTPALEAFRVTRAGVLLLGRVFNPWHFLAYGLAIAMIASIDHWSNKF